MRSRLISHAQPPMLDLDYSSSDDQEPEAQAPSGEKTDVQLARGLEVLKSWTYFEKLRDNKAGAHAGTAKPAVASVPKPSPTP